MANPFKLHITATKKIDGKVHRQSATLTNETIDIEPLTRVDEESRLDDDTIEDLEVVEDVSEYDSTTSASPADEQKSESLFLEHFKQQKDITEIETSSPIEEDEPLEQVMDEKALVIEDIVQVHSSELFMRIMVTWGLFSWLFGS